MWEEDPKLVRATDLSFFPVSFSSRQLGSGSSSMATRRLSFDSWISSVSVRFPLALDEQRTSLMLEIGGGRSNASDHFLFLFISQPPLFKLMEPITSQVSLLETSTFSREEVSPSSRLSSKERTVRSTLSVFFVLSLER